MSYFRSKKILIADDEPSMRSTLADILVDNGFEVATAKDGLTAIEMCKQDKFDLVLMDVRMPGIDGVEAFRMIREISGDLQVILMSAYGEDEIKHKAINDGAVAFLDKPLNLETVLQIVTKASELSILAVTNDDGLIDLLSSRLGESARRISICRTADEGLQLARQIHFDITLIDTQLPSTNGLDFYLALRNISFRTSAVMISDADRANLEIAAEAVRRTAYSVLKKPLRIESLTELIDVLKRQQISDAIRKPDSNDI